MAKQVEDIVVRLVGEGFEALDKIKGSFRELGKVTNLAEKDILSARDSLLDYARKAGNTEAVNKGLTDAFKGLRSQVDLSSEAYRSLSGELRRLDEESKGATRSVMAQRDAVLSSTAAGTQNVAALQQQRAALIALRTQTRESSTAFNQFSADIQAVETRLTNLAEVNRRFNAVLVQGTAATAAGARVQLDALTAGIALRRQDLADIDTRSARERNLRATIEQRLGVEQRLNTALSMRRRIQFQEGARTGREGARTGAATFNDPTVTAGFLAPDRIAQRIGDLPNTTAGLSQELGELNERLVNTYRNTDAYLQVAMQMAGVQRELTSVTRGYAQALLMGIRTGATSPSMRNLQEAATALRAEMVQLDTTTTEGSRAYADNAREANALERRLRTLADAYREVGSMATVAATAEQNAANAPIRNNYLNRGAVRQQEQALRQLGEQVRQGVAGTPLLLPAAGQTSAPGTGQARSGGARRLTGQVETTFGAGVDVRGYSPRSTFQQQFLPTAAVGAPPAVGFAEGAGQRDALMATSAAARATEQQMQRLRAAVDIATKANTGSVTSLGRLREALVNLRNEIPGTEKEFRDLNQQVGGVDRRASRLQTSRRPSTGQLVQAGGAAISGGIFGGPEGFLGGVGGAVLGTALPGIGTAGGAFAGAAAGAQVGMFRQQLAGTADYAASIGKLQIALRGVVGSQAAYDEAIRSAAAATRDLNIPQEEATRGLTRLSAAVIGAGGTVGDSSFAFRAMSEAIKATGGNAEQVDGALLALTQVFSKGKVSAEELNQIAERLPGTFTLFAQAAGKTGPELQKALEQGEVGLNDLMKFLDLTSKRYGTTALEIAGSSQDAGARLTVAFQAMRLEVGKALQPLGAELQGAFAAFIKDITPAVVGSAKALAAALSFFTNNEAAGGLARFALQAGAVALAIKGLQAASARLVALNIASWFTGAASGATQLQLPIAGATTKVGIFKAAVTGLGTALKALLPLAVITITVDVIVKGLAQLIAAREELRKLRNERNPVPGEGEGIGPKLVLNAERRYTGASREKIIRDQQEQQKFVAGLRKQLQDLEATQSGLGTAYGQTAIGGIANIGRGFEQENTKEAIEILKEKITASEEVLNLNVRTFKTEAEIEKARQAALSNKFADPTGGEDASTKAADKARRDAEAAAAEQQRLNEALAKAAIAFDDEGFRNRMELIRKEYEYKQELDNKARDLFIKSQTGAARETAGQLSGFLGEFATLTTRLITASDGVKTATQQLKSAKAMAATTVGSPMVAGATRLPGSNSGRLDASGENGADMPVGANNAIRSYHNGIVKELNRAGANGNYVVIEFLDDLGNRLEATYSHLAATVRKGETVVGGQVIGRFDGSGNTRGAHNSIDINSLGNNGDYNRRQETPAARRSADLLVRGQVQGTTGGRQPTGVGAAIRRDVAAEGGAATATANLEQAKALMALEERQVKALMEGSGKGFVLDLTDALRQQNAALKDTAELTELRNRLQFAGERTEIIDAEVSKAEAVSRTAKQIDLLTQALEGLKAAPKPDEALISFLTEGIAKTEDELAQFTALTDAAAAVATAPGAKIRAFIGDAKRELADLESVAISISQGIGDAVGNSLASGISGLIEGTASAKQVFGNFLRDIGQILIKEGTKMIATYIAIAIARAIAGLATGGGGGNAATAMGSNPNLNAYAALPKGYANGGTFAKNGIVPYAKGGTFSNSVVSSPTLFKFAAGGTTRTGLMGEAGPEAIMPLKRGFDGRLGVAQVRTPSGGDTRMRDMMGRSPAQQTTPVLNMSFQSTTINGVEYVSRDQLEAAMAQTRRQAAKDGANRGMNMTLDKIQNSPSTRSRVGIR